MAGSRALGGARPLSMIACLLAAVVQLSLDAITAPLPSCSSSVGSANTPLTPKWPRAGPSARRSTCLLSLPVMTKPPIRTLSPVSTFRRAEMLSNCAGGAGGKAAG